MSILLSPLQIKSVLLKNRIVISPMCQYSSVDGFANDWHLVHLGSRATGGAGLIIQEATAVSPEGRISPEDAGLWKDEHIEKWRTIVDFIHSHGSVAGIQLAHAGRKASAASPWKGGRQIKIGDGGWQTHAPSAIPFHHSENTPLALDADGIRKAVEDFGAATQRAVLAGYKLVEIHAAHGYLIHQFLSPLSNQRTDDYGGAFENRIRFLLEIVAAVQKEWPADQPLFVRISATDYAEGGWNIGESAKLAGILKSKGVDLIDCSSGGLVPGVKIELGPGYQVPFSERIKKEAGMLTGAVGLITEVKHAEEILQAGKADLILIARQSLRDPNFALHAAAELGEEIAWPPQYERARL
ncbi:MAG: NADH:flavin oxidoreductase/NADH oxidase [Gemmatimonadaceae bacterium]|nr:NADH:flavin oxidoreductase/NADH oxidase [Chitinophagaceae bacterium]